MPNERANGYFDYRERVLSTNCEVYHTSTDAILGCLTDWSPTSDVKQGNHGNVQNYTIGQNRCHADTQLMFFVNGYLMNIKEGISG